jgi:Ca-activated chloride channel family protein
MSTRDDVATEQDERYHEAVASYFQALDRGSDPDRRQWLEGYPEVASRLDAFFANHDYVRAARRPPAAEAPTRSFYAVPLLSDEEVARRLPLEDEPGFGALTTAKGALPLQAMQVYAQIEGLLAHVTVSQTFVNTLDELIEATYVFPLPDRMAVTRFLMEVGGREVEGVLKERAAARQEYTAVIKQGHQAAITEEERPGTFTMRVGNLMPGEEAVVQLAMVGSLPCDNGESTFRFPLVVAPRYVPGKPLPGPSVGTGTIPDTDKAPDASRVTSPTLLPGYLNPVRLALAVDVHLSSIPCTISAVASTRCCTPRMATACGASAVRTSLAVLPDAGGSKGEHVHPDDRAAPGISECSTK